jgi:hypothetical protein
MKYHAKQLATGQWAVWYGSRYFPNTITSDAVKAQSSALVMSARWHQDQMDRIHRKLEAIPGFVSQQDPKGYLA